MASRSGPRCLNRPLKKSGLMLNGKFAIQDAFFSILLTSLRRVEERPPVHDGDESRFGREPQKKALTGLVDCIRSVVAEPDLCGEQWLWHAPGTTGRCVEISGHQRSVGRHEEKLPAVSSPAGILPSIM